MLDIYIFFVSLALFCNLGSLYFAWRIRNLKLTSSFTWSVVMAAFTARIVAQLLNLRYARPVVDIFRNDSVFMVLLSHGVQAAGLLCFLIAFGRIYRNRVRVEASISLPQ